MRVLRFNRAAMRRIRRANDITFVELGKRIKVSPSFLNGIERGNKKVSLSNLNRIAGGLGVDVGELIDFQEVGNAIED